MRRLASFRDGFPRLHNRVLAGPSFFYCQMSRYDVANADHRVMVPMQSGIRRNPDPEHGQLRLSSSIAVIVFAIPRLRRLENLLYLDSWLARTQHSRDQPKG